MNNKKKKANRRLKCVGEDRISELPDAIIIHILSLLASTKLCVKTCVLSKRWHHLWTFVPNIIFDEHDFPYILFDERRHHIMERVVNKTLALRSSSKLNNFSIQISDIQDMYPSFESWLQLAVERAVESLTLDFIHNGHSSTGYLLPQFLYSNSHIRILTTEVCEFVPDGRISWSALKELSIRQATLTDEVIQNILYGTPLLEDLELNFCHGIKLLDLSLKPKLKNLVVNVQVLHVNDSRYYHFELKIVGPYVETLKLSWSRDNFKCKLMNMSSLVKATLDIDFLDDDDYIEEWYPNMVKELVENVLPAEQLQLTNYCTQALSTLRMDVMASLSSNLRSLDVDCRGEEYLYGIECVLQCAHKLEKLVIFFDYGRSSKSKYDGYTKDYWTNAEIPSCLDSHLKTIEISGLIRTRVVVEFLQFLLKNSRVLDKMVLRHFNHKYGLILAERLSSYPRSSQKAVFLAPKSISKATLNFKELFL
ncbi:putative F-box/LRR-repeat protein At3g18150 [Mercurialis annua]|uniref:putative F-box/LRR-repeat protein At3g18150 n=1 Tax=Mercurialis annua TaxID=3986 RepID=UPI00215E690C|nr:putative F-box/LRR-repeat protein At3g18150 [Mercurialis annua]